jgi:hypothetical protein
LCENKPGGIGKKPKIMPNAGCGQNGVAVKSQKIAWAIGTTSAFERNITI